MKKIISLLLTALILSCLTALAQESFPITIKLEKSELEGDDVSLSAVADQISYIKLESHSDALIGHASRYSVTQIPKGFLIWSIRGGKIYLFNTDGKFRGIVGSEGKGPGEYYGVYKVLYDKYLDNILVLLSNKVLRYDTNGVFISSVEIDKNNGRVENFCVKDDQTWLFTYKKPFREDLFEIGVLATNKEGKKIKQYDLTNRKCPGSYSYHTQMNRVYQRKRGTYYIQYDYYQTYKLNKDDQWIPYVLIDVPFKKTPIDLFKGHNPLKLDEVRRENGQLLSAFIYRDLVKIRGATPQAFNVFVDLDTKEKLYYGFNKGLNKFGFINDLDGGLPSSLPGMGSDDISLEMIDAIKLLDYSEKGLLKPDGKDHGPHMNLKEVLELSKPDDNPIIVVVKAKL